MRIGNLDNEVYFKKVFTNIEVFEAFVKDILGIEVEIVNFAKENIKFNSDGEHKEYYQKFYEDLFYNPDNKISLDILKTIENWKPKEKFNVYKLR